MFLQCAVYIPLLPERDESGIYGYKHIAPLEQNVGVNKDDFFVQSRFEANKP